MARDRPSEIPATRPPEPADAPETEQTKGKKVEPKKPTEPEGHLKAELQAVQAQALEPAPQRVPLIVPPKDEMGQPAAEPPSAPPPAKKTPAPRFVHENERAPEGLKRFKIRALNYGLQEQRYVLAPDEQTAREHYVRGVGLHEVAQVLGEGAPEPLLSVVRLPD